MGRTADKRKGVSTSRNESPERREIPDDYEFDEWTPPRGYKKPKAPANSLALRNLNPEAHPWLNWPGADKVEKANLNAKLSELQSHQVSAPRLMDWDMIRELGIAGRFETLFETKCELPMLGQEASFPMWNRIFNLNERVIREWCLEFYSSLWVETDVRASEVHTRKIIHFRAGGKQRHCTILEFGYLTGMFTFAELNNDNLRYFLRAGIRETSGFDDDDQDGFWERISGNEKHSSKTSKISDIYDPVLRILHKLIAYNFFHRTNQQDKPYVDDLWLMRLFFEGAPYRYACAPYTLADHMAKQKDGFLCGGHFISKIFRRLDCDGSSANRASSVPIAMREISWRDLSSSKLLRPGTRVLIEAREPTDDDEDDDNDDDDEDDDNDDDDEEMVEVERRSKRRAEGTETSARSGRGTEDVDPFSFEGLARQLGFIQGEQSSYYDYQRGWNDSTSSEFEKSQKNYQEDQRYMRTEFERLNYDRERYQPYWEDWASREATNLGRELPPYSPPEVYTPPHWQSGYYYPHPPPPPPGPEPFFQPRTHDAEAGGSGAGTSGTFTSMFTEDEPFFGTKGGTFEGGGVPSVFGDPDDPDY